MPPRRSTRNNPTPSATALGKRRAESPPPAPPAKKPKAMSTRKGSRASRAKLAKANADDPKGKGPAPEPDPEPSDDDSPSDDSHHSDEEDEEEEDDEDLELPQDDYNEDEYHSGEPDLADLLDIPGREGERTASQARDEASAAIEAAMDAAEDAALDAAAARQYLAGLGDGGGAGFRALHGMMSGMSTRLKGILVALRCDDGDASPKLAALQDLAELLSVSTEDTLSGYFQVEAFVKEIVTILKGENVINADSGDGGESGGMTAEEMIAFGIAPGSQGGGDGGSAEESNVQMMLLACRCLANLMEALPGSAHSVVYAGAVPVLCSKLMEIQYIDLAEQTMSTLEKISEEVPSAIVRAGGLSALLTYLDFFSFHVQRTAVTAAANCCRSLTPESFTMVRDVMPIVKNVLGYSDQRVVEQACLAVVRIVESYRHYPDKLEALLTADILASIRVLLNPESTTVGTGTYTQTLKMLSTASRASPAVAIALVELNIANTLYHLLTGVAPPELTDEAGIQVVHKDGDVSDIFVMQNLVQRPKEQIQETLGLVCELLPPLPKDGIFDSRAYSGKDRSKSKGKEAAKSSEASRVASTSAAVVEPVVPDVQMEGDLQIPSTSAAESLPITRESSRGSKYRDPVKMALVEKRLELLNAGPESRNLVVKRYFALMLPALIDVYSASVNSHVRAKAVLGLSKIINFCDEQSLASILKSVPMSSFLAAILSSRDQAPLVTSALQLVELFLVKLPNEYTYFFRREGVMHEIERIASEPIRTPSKSKRASPSRTPKATKADEASSTSSSGLARALEVQAFLSDAPRAVDDKVLTPADALVLDQITRRAQHLRDTYVTVDSEPTIKARLALEAIQGLVTRLEQVVTGAEARDTAVEALVQDVVALFADDQNPLSSFELLQSGLVEGLLRFATEPGVERLSVTRCQELLAKAFMPQLIGSEASSAFATLVKRLQESLSRMEEFEVILAGQNASEPESRRNGPSMLARQLKLRLIAEEGSDIPRSCSNVVVSIHAIATFQAFNDYLRPRILAASALSDRSGAPSGRLSSFLAAFAAAEGDEEGDEDPAASGSDLRATGGTGAAATAGDDGAPSRRRSSRLSGKAPEPAEDPSAPARATSEMSTSTHAMEHDDSFADEAEDDLFAGDFEADSLAQDERPVNLEVAADGSKVVVKTPDGTRVHTPTPGKKLPRSAAPKPRASYAAAVKSEPTDFHIEFTMGDVDIGLDTTVYGAVHNFDARTPENRRNMWTNIYTVKFRKVAGPARPESDSVSPESPSRDELALTSVPDSIPAESRQAKILLLLCVLHTLNADHGDSTTDNEYGAIVGLAESAFINNKLTAKLNRQLEEPMIVASACLPDWAVDLPQFFPFLFPFDTRFTFLQSTAFGYARLMQKWVGQARIDSSRRDDNLGFLGRLQRQKVRISRERMLESAFKVFELYGASRASLEVEFFSEVGSGLGPTLEFYALVSKEFARKDLSLWRDGDASNPSAFVYNLSGLFPSPTEDFDSEAGKKRMRVFRMLGQFVAKAMMDSRIIDVNFNSTFMKLVLDYDIPLTIATVKTVDKELGRSLAHLQEYLTLKAAIESDSTKLEAEQGRDIEAIEIDGVKIQDLFLDFTLPGHAIDLRPDGKDIGVDIHNLEQYISLVVEWTLHKGIAAQMTEFKAGFTTVFPVRDLQSFTPLELVMMTGALEEDWSVEGLASSTKADHGFTMDSRPVRDVLSIMSELSLPERREFLSFITGSPRLPIGGFAALTPSLTIVRKDGGDGSLPSVMTCVNYIKLPDYTSREIVKARIMTAVREGAGGFHLS